MYPRQKGLETKIVHLTFLNQEAEDGTCFLAKVGLFSCLKQQWQQVFDNNGSQHNPPFRYIDGCRASDGFAEAILFVHWRDWI